MRPAAMHCAIELRHVRKAQGHTLVLDDLNLSVARGEVGLLGPNGSGKSTALRIIAGLLAADAGESLVEGRPLEGDDPCGRGRIGYLPERAPLYEALTVRKELREMFATPMAWSLSITRTDTSTLCFPEGHGEADPFSLEAQDHAEGLVGPGLGAQDNPFGRALVTHEREGMGMARSSVESLGYRVQRLSLLQEKEVPGECRVLLVAGPRHPLVAREEAALGRWLDRSGKLVVLLDRHNMGLARLLGRYGIRVGSAPVLDPEHHYGTDEGTPAVSRYPRHKVTRNLLLTFFPGAVALSMAHGADPQVRHAPFLQTSRAAASYDGPSGTRTLGVLASRTRESPAGNHAPGNSELVVVGDSDFARNSHFAALGNGALLLNIVNHLAEQDDLSGIRPRSYELPQVTLTNVQMRFTFLVSTVLLPLTAFALAIRAWLRRR